MALRGLFFLFTLWFIFSCKDEEKPSVKGQNLIIDVLPFNDVPDEQITFAVTELKKIYPEIELKKTIALPQSSYYSKRNRYRADSLIRYLRSITPNGHVTIGLTTKDISYTKGKNEDYGIMGLGYNPGNACVVSTFRLSKENKSSQFFKLCIHELGHTAGLPHCPVKTCFMRDAEGKNYLNEETAFCESCKTFLISKNWNLKATDSI